MESLLIWFGSGFAFAMGVFCGFALIKFSGKESSQSMRLAEESLRELQRRNSIGGQQVDYLERIAEAMESRQI